MIMRIVRDCTTCKLATPKCPYFDLDCVKRLQTHYCRHWRGEHVEDRIIRTCPYCEYTEFLQYKMASFSYNKPFRNIIAKLDDVDDTGENIDLWACPNCGLVHCEEV